MNKRTLSLALACALSLVLLAACGGNETPAPAPAPEVPEQSEPATPETPDVELPAPGENTEDEQIALELSHTDVTLNAEGKTFVLSTNLSDATLYFGSSDESVATVDENGTVTAVAPGTANIMVETEDGQTATCIVRCDWTVEAEPEAPETPDAPAASNVDLQAFYTQLMESIPEDNRPFMMELVGEDMAEMAENVYPGIGAIAANQKVLATPAMSAVAFEIAMVECANAADVEAVKAIFQARVDAQIDGGAWYPETIDGWMNFSKIVTNGNFVALFVADPALVDAAGEFAKLF